MNTHRILPRTTAAAIERAARIAPVVVLSARQTGKTTLLQTLPRLIGRIDG